MMMWVLFKYHCDIFFYLKDGFYLLRVTVQGNCKIGSVAGMVHSKSEVMRMV